MKLPNARQARVQREKITGYLLAENPESGRGKPGFFARLGFNAENWRELADALKAVASAHEVTLVEETDFGVKYVIEGSLATPDGRNPRIRTIWQIDWGSDRPRLVSAYPLNQERER